MSLCAACGADNRAGRKFCGRCGAALGVTCSACGTANQSDELFCGECGAALAPPASSSPKTVPVSGEKKQITVLFADVAGSMDLQEQLDAEVWAQIMGRFVSILAEGVRKFGGTVDKFTGDGIMALFGAPVAQEDHARRASHAAWHLTRAIREYSDELRREQGVELNVRLGLNSGEVVVGRVGDDITLDPTALGHTVGLAQRMEAMAGPGKAYLTERTARLVAGWFRLTELGPTVVKGSRQPLAVFELGRPSQSGRQPRSGAADDLFVGREREIAVLAEALAAAEEGSAQVVGVVGEAGVGKSRLCEEFARAAARRGVTVQRTAGVSHGQNLPLLPILSLLRSYFGVNETDDPGRAREHVSRLLIQLDPALEDSQPVLLDFLAIADANRPVVDQPAPVRLRRIFETLRRITAARTERETLLLIAEDLQWFDRQSLVFFERLLESFPGSRTMVVTNFRPEFSAAWMRHSYYRQLSLGPLNREGAADLLHGLLGDHASISGLVSRLMERTGGNPFFLEEMVRVLAEDGTLTGQYGHYRLVRPINDATLPASVHAVLAARIDRLPPSSKSVLQSAAVLGRSFSGAVLSEMTGPRGELLDDALACLCSAELIQQSEARPDQYRFWHPLTQEVAYGSLLTDRCTQLHAAAARAIVHVGPERSDERASLVAWHFEQAGNALETARWNARAAAWTLRTDLNEAVRRWRATIALLDSAPETHDSLRLAAEARGRLLQLGARIGLPNPEATRLYGEAKELAQKLGNRALLAAVTRFAAAVAVLHGELRVARDQYFEAVALADQTDEPEFQASVRYAPTLACIHVGPVDDGLTAAERTMGLCGTDTEFGAHHLGYSPLVRSRAHRAELLALAGRLGEARAEATATVALARRRHDLEAVAWTLTTLVRLSDRAGTGTPATVTWAGEAVRITEETGNLVFWVIARNALSIAHLMDAHFDQAADVAGRTLEDIRGPQQPRYDEVTTLVALARAHLALGDRGTAARFADDAVETAQRQGASILECFARLIRARVARTARRTGTDPALDLDVALRLVHETGALTYEPFVHEELGRLHHDEHDLRNALRLYRQIGATGHTRRLAAELSTSVTP